MKFRETHPSQFVSNFSPWHPVDATGGTESTITVSGITYRLHVFTSIGSDTLTINDSGSDGIVEFLVVAGGGGGGMDMGGGGGGGGVISGRHTVISGQNLSVTVGAGGLGAPGGSEQRSDGGSTQPGGHQFTIPATSGGNSVFGPYTATGGGFGGSSYRGYTPGIAGGSGGSGGGASGYNDNAGTFNGGAGTYDQGRRGGNSTAAYYSGGGGGAGGQGVDSTSQSNGGIGAYSDILGTGLYWGGGGGGSAYSLANGGNGGLGGGGGGAVGTASGGGSALNPGQAGGGGSPNAQTNTRGGNAGVNTGGGGGGGSHYNATNSGGEGGSGIVVVRYPLNRPLTPYISSGLKLYLDADDISSYPGSGTIWYDISGNGNNYNIVSGARQTSGGISYMDFGGSYGCAKNASDTNFASTQNATIILWTKLITSTATWRTLIRSYVNDHQVIVQAGANTLGMYDNDVSGFISAGVDVTNVNSRNLTSTWNMMTFKLSSTESQYQVLINNNSAAGTINNAAAAFTRGFGSIGAYHDGNTTPSSASQYWGQIAIFMVYDRILTNAEIAINYNYFKSRFGL